MIFASWTIYIKYQMVNYILLNCDKYDNDKNSDCKGLKNMHLTIATVCQICISFIIAKFCYGRRIQIIYVIIFLIFIFELIICVEDFFDLQRNINNDNNAGQYDYAFVLKATFIYLLYFMVCQFGIVDVAKEETLKNNFRLGGSLLCLVIGSQQILNAIVLERYMHNVSFRFILYIYFYIQFVDNVLAKNLIDLSCNFAVLYFLYDMWKT